MKILIADSFPQHHLQQLTEQGHDCRYDPALGEDTLPAAIADHELLIVRSTRVVAATIDSGGRLQLVIRAGAGTNTIDKAHAASKGVRVSNVPGANSVAVAELTLGLILAIDRQLPANVADLKQQVWNKKKYSKARGLFGQSIGILGVGSIGIAVAERAVAFGMKVLVLAKPNRNPETKARIAALQVRELDSLAALVQQSDIVSLHLPASGDTRNLVDQSFLANMKDGAMLINTSRGELVDEAALLAALDSKGIRAGLDVYCSEPAAGDNQFVSKIAQHPMVCGSHHIGASTEQAQTAVADGVLRVIRSFEAGALLYCVNQ